MRNQAQGVPKKFTAEQRRALKMLADAYTHGCAEAVLRAQGFDAAMLGELVNAGLASVPALTKGFPWARGDASLGHDD